MINRRHVVLFHFENPDRIVPKQFRKQTLEILIQKITCLLFIKTQRHVWFWLSNLEISYVWCDESFVLLLCLLSNHNTVWLSTLPRCAVPSWYICWITKKMLCACATVWRKAGKKTKWSQPQNHHFHCIGYPGHPNNKWQKKLVVTKTQSVNCMIDCVFLIWHISKLAATSCEASGASSNQNNCPLLLYMSWGQTGLFHQLVGPMITHKLRDILDNFWIIDLTNYLMIFLVWHFSKLF